jgi:hypothetical protein
MILTSSSYNLDIDNFNSKQVPNLFFPINMSEMKFAQDFISLELLAVKLADFAKEIKEKKFR